MGGAAQGHATFVGRDRELARLSEVLRRAADGDARVLLVAGEAGVGKTRLVDEALGPGRAEGLRILEGGCLQFGPSGPPYAPVVAVLRSLVASVEPGALAAILGPGRAVLAGLVPEFAERAPVTAPAPPDATSQIRLFELVSGALGRLARLAPLVVIVEDVHWVDVSSRELLDFLVRGLRGDERLLLILTVRTDAQASDDATRLWIAELSRLPIAERLDLGPLPRDAVGAMVDELTGGIADPALVDRLGERANGNPFLIEELVAAGGVVEELPEPLRELLLARLAPLTDTTRSVLRAAAAGGRWVDDALLATVLGLDEETVRAALRQAVANGSLVRTTGPTGAGAYAFRHTLLRDAIEEELFPGERARLHAAYAAALEQRAGAGPSAVEPAELARHWDQAGDPVRAIGAYVRAARLATRVYAWPEARRSYDRALELWTGVADPETAAGIRRLDLLLETANVCGLQGQYARAVELAREALRAIDPADGPGREAEIRESLRWFLFEAGDRVAAAAELAEALRITPTTPPSAVRARVLAHAAGLAIYDDRPAEALAGAEEAIAMARAVNALPEEALGLAVAGWATATLGDVDAGVARFREAMVIARLLGAVEGIALGYTNLAAILDRAGRTGEALEVARDGFAEIERYGLRRTFGAPLLADAARMLSHLGRWDEAEGSLAEAASLAVLPEARLMVALERGRLAAMRGRFEVAGAALATATELERSLGGTAHDGELLEARLELAVLSGQLPDGRRIVDEALGRPLADPVPDPPLAWVAALGLRLEADAAEVARATRDAAALREAAERARRIERWLRAAAPALRRIGAVGAPTGDPGDHQAAHPDGRIRGIVDLCRAERDRLRGRVTPAVWAAVGDDWGALGRPLVVGYARYREGVAHLAASNDRPAAIACLREALAIARRLGAVPLETAVTRFARVARLDLAGATEAAVEPGRAAGPDGLGLTPRELEVLRLVAEGWSNPEIAEALGISPKTASVHVSNTLAKLGVSGRVEAAVLANRMGLGPDRGSEHPLPSGSDRVHRTFMVTDIVSSRELTTASGDRPSAELRDWHDRTLRSAFARHRGVEIDHAAGGFFVAFPSAVDAVACAVEIQRSLAEHGRRTGVAPAVRIGLHSGPAEPDRRGTAGPAMQVASRIADRAEGGQILASTATIHEARVAAARPVEASLPGVDEPVEVAQLAW